MSEILTARAELTRGSLETRLRELEPAVEEARAIRRMLNAWDEVAAVGRRDPRVQPHAGSSGRHSGRRNLPTEARKAQIRRLVRERPGLRRSDIAEAIGLTRARA